MAISKREFSTKNKLRSFENLENSFKNNTLQQQQKEEEAKAMHFQNEEINKLKSEFEEWKRFLKTNLQGFFENLSKIPNLHSLNLSNNKIQFFDIDPFSIKEKYGYAKLKKLDISYNKIEEGIALLLVMNLPLLEYIDITKNPIIDKKAVYESVEYEIFKNKNIFLENKDKNPEIIPYLNGKKNVLLHQPYYVVKRNKIKSLNEFKKTVHKKIEAIKKGNRYKQFNF